MITKNTAIANKPIVKAITVAVIEVLPAVAGILANVSLSNS